eukprot:gene11804-biopygen1861
MDFWRRRGHRTLARAWRGRGASYRRFLVWVARAWRGHGVGIARAWPVTPGAGKCIPSATGAGKLQEPALKAPGKWKLIPQTPETSGFVVLHVLPPVA